MIIANDTPHCPGTGKSLLLRAIITALRKKHAKKNGAVSVTASTGMAASNIGGTFLPSNPATHSLYAFTSFLSFSRSFSTILNRLGHHDTDTLAGIGMTIHSWGAISPMVEDVEKLIRDIRTAKPALQRWRETKVLVIDESKSTFKCQSWDLR